MTLLQCVELRVPPADLRNRFPFTIPSLASRLGDELPFDAPVTFLVGENGSGKSTFL